MNILDRLSSLEQESIKQGIPIIGREKAAAILKIIEKSHPKDILELGTANGYSGIVLASQNPQAKLVTIEKDKSRVAQATQNFKKFNINAKIITGNVLEEIKKLKNHKFNLIFIDFSKHNYIKVLADCLRLAKQGGLIIADNITHPNCQNYLQAVLNHPKLKTEIINIKDGIAVSRKI